LPRSFGRATRLTFPTAPAAPAWPPAPNAYGISFVTNFLGAGEYPNADPAILMGQPYARVVVLQVVLKIGMDLVAHERERIKLRPTAPAV